ncbi:MAG: hypothetical protein GWP59_01515 [Chlamydiales bacterium]|nr:hypothetical protein [Chlamydiales bacterium]NCF70357.1 hypothetical protein [Chlamydiales bacterium]
MTGRPQDYFNHFKFCLYSRYLESLSFDELPFSFALEPSKTPPRAIFSCLLEDAYLVIANFAYKGFRAVLEEEKRHSFLSNCLYSLGYELFFINKEAPQDSDLIQREESKFTLYFSTADDESSQSLINMSQQLSQPIIKVNVITKSSYMIRSGAKWLLPFSAFKIVYGKPIVCPHYCSKEELLVIKKELLKSL